jgi:hypothetical protein
MDNSLLVKHKGFSWNGKQYIVLRHWIVNYFKKGFITLDHVNLSILQIQLSKILISNKNCEIGKAKKCFKKE